MVTFTCNGCGSTLKKKQVATHRIRCRNSQCVSCIDCLKDFVGEEYDNHMKCITEDQKYGGEGFEAPVEKGALKQQQWIEKIQKAIEEATELSDYERQTLRKVAAFPNMPRKKPKFLNFVTNSLKIRNEELLNKVWNFFDNVRKSEEKQTTGMAKNAQSKDGSQEASSNQEKKPEPAENGVEENDENLSKKEKRKKKREAQQSGDDVNNTTADGEQSGDTKLSKKEKKRRKSEQCLLPVSNVEDSGIMDTEEVVNDTEKSTKKKKKKRRDDSLTAEDSTHGDAELADDGSNSKLRDEQDDAAAENGQEQQDGSSKILSKKEKRKKKKEEERLARERTASKQENDKSELNGSAVHPEEGATTVGEDIPKNLSKKERKKMIKRMTQEQEELKEPKDTVEEASDMPQKLSKKERKKKNREAQNGLSEHVNGVEDEVEEGGKKKKGKNKKRLLSGGSEAAGNVEGAGKKNKKHRTDSADAGNEEPLVNGASVQNGDAGSGEDDDAETSQGPRKFRWDKAIKTALKEYPEDGLAIKKLKKKVLAHYYAMGGEGKGEVSVDDLSATFNYKLNHNPKFKVFKDRAMLVKK